MMATTTAPSVNHIVLDFLSADGAAVGFGMSGAAGAGVAGMSGAGAG